MAAVQQLNLCQNLQKKELYKIAENLPSRIKDTNDMLNIIDHLSNKCIPDNTFLINFDVENMFPGIHNESLRLCLECNNSIFAKGWDGAWSPYVLL